MKGLVLRNIIVIPIPGWVFNLLRQIGAEETVLTTRQQIMKHLHKFLAVYFTCNVKYIETVSGVRRLPSRAMVVVLPNTIHGWVDCVEGVPCGIVAHFHPGHPAHSISSI
jgi:hypothetical protein